MRRPGSLCVAKQVGSLPRLGMQPCCLSSKKKKATFQAWEGGIWGKWAEKPLLDLSWFLNFQALDFFAERCFSGRGSSDSHPSPFNAVLSAASRALGSSCQRTGKSLV